MKPGLWAKKKGLTNKKKLKAIQVNPVGSDETFDSILSSESSTWIAADQWNRAKRCYVAEVIENKGWFSDKPEDALIAFPNDRPRSLRPWPERKVIRY